MEPTDWGSDGPEVLWFDEWPPAFAVYASIVTAGIGLGFCTVPELKWLGWIVIAAALPMPLIRSRLHLDFRVRAWRYRRGLWPFVYGSVGGFEQLYGIEITKPTIHPASYVASLHWHNGILSKKRLYSSDSFDRLARPALALAAQLGVPIVLDHDMAVFYAARLDNIKAGVAYVSPTWQ